MFDGSDEEDTVDNVNITHYTQDAEIVGISGTTGKAENGKVKFC